MPSLSVILRTAAFLCLAGLQSAALATTATPGNVESSESAAHLSNASEKIAIAPHHAVYNMRLASVKNGSNVVDVTGKLDFEWNDACDGWTVGQHLNMHFSYNEGDESEIKSSEASWEAKDGKSYSFNVHHTNNGHDTDNYRGKVTLGSMGGKAIYSLPSNKTVSLPAGSLFPSAHTLLILQKAAAGEKFFTKRVFDGTDEEGASDVSVFIGTPMPHAEKVDAAPSLKNQPLLNHNMWPIRMAFFKEKTTTGAPDYEMDLSMLSNGVIEKMRVDYGDFVVTGTLSDIKALTPSGC